MKRRTALRNRWLKENGSGRTKSCMKAQPGANDLTAEKAFEIAVQAFAEDFGIDRGILTASALTDETFLLRENGRGVWDISFAVILNDVESDCVVRLDGATGEVLSIDVLTGRQWLMQNTAHSIASVTPFDLESSGDKRQLNLTFPGF